MTEGAPRLRDELKRLKMLDPEAANEILTPDGEAVDRSAPKQLRAEAWAEAAEQFRKGRRRSSALCHLHSDPTKSAKY